MLRFHVSTSGWVTFKQHLVSHNKATCLKQFLIKNTCMLIPKYTLLNVGKHIISPNPYPFLSDSGSCPHDCITQLLHIPAVNLPFCNTPKMDGDKGETITETSKPSKNELEKPVNDNKFRGRGFKGRGRGGWMNRGGMRGGRGMMKGFGPPGAGRGGRKDGAMNGFAPRRGMGRMHPYPDLRGHRGQGGPMCMGPPLPLPPPPLPPMHHRGTFPPMTRHGPLPPPPPGHPAFRGRPHHPRGRGLPPPGPLHYFHPHGPRGPTVVVS
uniref:DNA-binding protein K10 isoform X3 n=1 Tax=Solea senegalensis TaxID=28829 RepID=UPI001CD90D9F|nr:DNA-binding protein K10 isoform X3 [Solea senegalensis]